MARILHLISEADWTTAQTTGHWEPPSLRDEGFIHCSKDEEQAVRVVQRLYPDRADLLALEVDTDKLESSVISEASRSGEIYPHIYGPLNTGAVVKVWRVKSNIQGGYFLSDE